MKTKKIFEIIPFILLIAVYTSASAQNPVLIQKESQIRISGTSNLHDWHEVAKDFTIEIGLSADEAVTPVIDRVSLSCRTASIVSDNSIMTNKTHDALRVDRHPEITFSSAEQSSLVVRNGEFSSTISGELTINGVMKQVAVPVQGSLTGNKLNVRGSKTIKMSDFDVKAPVALMGTLKTGDEVTVSFDLKFEVPSDNVIITALNK
jgi:polyisoprenoid-binding protein YceI